MLDLLNSFEQSEIQFKGVPVKVRRKPYYRKLRLKIDELGNLEVIASQSLPVRFISQFINEKASWIEKQLLQAAVKQKNLITKTVFHGLELPYLDTQVIVCTELQKDFKNEGLLLKKNGRGSDVSSQIRRWYLHKAEQFIPQRLQMWADLMGLQFTEVALKDMKSRWGSCSTVKKIVVNWRLIAAPSFVIDYVLVHELAHLRHLNHSPSFWKVVAIHYPEWKSAEAWLRDHSLRLNFLRRNYFENFFDPN